MRRHRPTGTRPRHLVAVVVVTLLGAGLLAVVGTDRPAAAAVSAGVTERVSVADDETQGIGPSTAPAMSATGRYVAFVSTARLDPLDDPSRVYADVYLRDTETGHTVLLSRGHQGVGGGVDLAAVPDGPEVAANGPSHSPSISADGRYVAFVTRADNIVRRELYDSSELVICDRDPDGDGVFDTSFGYTAISPVSRYDYTEYPAPSLSGDAGRLAFTRTTEDSRRVQLVGLRHTATGAIEAPAPTDFSTPTPPAVISRDDHDYELRSTHSAVLSGDGRHLALVGEYWIAVKYELNRPPIFALYDDDLTSNAITRIDLDQAGNVVDTGGEFGRVGDPALSGTGRLVAFEVTVPGLPAQVVRVLDRDPDADGAFAPAPGEPLWSKVVSLDTNRAEVAGVSPALSADGRYLAFVTDAAFAHNGIDDPTRQYSDCAHPAPPVISAHYEPTVLAGPHRPLAEPGDGPSAPGGGASAPGGGASAPGGGASAPGGGASAPANTGISYCDVVVRDLAVDRQREDASLPRLPAELASPSIGTGCRGFVAGGTCEGTGQSADPVLAADGSAVAYASEAEDLVTGDDVNRGSDVYKRTFKPSLRGEPFDFGAVELGTDLTLSVPVEHAGFGPLAPTSATVTGTDAGDFTVLPPDGCTGAILHETDRCLVPVRFSPGAIGPRTAFLELTWRGGAAPLRVPLTGTGFKVPPPETPRFSAAPNPLDFGTRPVGKRSDPSVLTVTNTGTAPLRVTAVTVVGAGPTSFADDYRITANTCLGTPVAPAASCQVTVVHRPLGIGVRPAVLKVDDDGEPVGVAHLVPVTGAGAQPVITAAPPLSAPGRVSRITGTGFPPSQPVTLTLDGMPGTTVVTTDADGAFTAALLILPHTFPGPRQLHGTTTVSAEVPAPVTVAAGTPYLVVAGTLQPPDFSVRR